MAAITAPKRTAAQHQSLLHFIGEGRWSDEKVLAKVRESVLPVLELRQKPVFLAHPQERPELTEKGYHRTPQNWFMRLSGAGPGGCLDTQ